MQAFLLDLAEPADSVPALASCTPKILNSHCLEVTIQQGESLTAVFQELAQHGIHVISMRNKSNRLEELFLQLIDAS
jgi:ABC-2 type transport system ATP-binding protein